MVKRTQATLCLGLLTLVALAQAGCERSLQDEREALYEFVEDNPIGDSASYWVVKDSPLTSGERVILVFGFLDDLAACQEIAERLQQNAPAATYSCERVRR